MSEYKLCKQDQFLLNLIAGGKSRFSAEALHDAALTLLLGQSLSTVRERWGIPLDQGRFMRDGQLYCRAIVEAARTLFDHGLVLKRTQMLESAERHLLQEGERITYSNIPTNTCTQVEQ